MVIEPMVQAVIRALTLMKCALANPPADISSDLIHIWTVTLANADLTPEDVERATTMVVSRETFFPAPVTFIRAIRPPINEDLAADAAWMTARACVQRLGSYKSVALEDCGGDRACLWAIQQMNWVRLCEELADDNQAILRAEFVRWYRLARDRRLGADYVPGRLELENRARLSLVGDLTPAMCGRPDWTALPSERPALPEPGALVRVGEPGAEELTPIRPRKEA
jgi:hypothetical protein